LVAGEATADPGAVDDELVREFQEGRPGTGARLYGRLLPVVDRALFRVLGRREHDYPDLVQSAFEQIVSTLSKRTFGQVCSLNAWASVLACHVGLNALRSRRRERSVVDRNHTLDFQTGPDPSPGVHPESQLTARDDLSAVRRHLAEMDPDRVMALLLNAEGYGLAEIAVLTSTSIAAAQSRLSRGRREIRARLESGGTQSQPQPRRLP
jgi:RNA polymerase sigma-70 factor (ECF subfamily)